jgi:hypothetical protein
MPEYPKGEAHSLSSDLFETPGNCEGCDKPESRMMPSSYGEGEYELRAYITWMPLLQAYVCTDCLSAYSSWSASYGSESEAFRNLHAPKCVKVIENNRKKEQ